VRLGLETFIAEHRPDEIVVTAMIHDHAARLRSFEIVSSVWAEMASKPLSEAAE